MTGEQVRKKIREKGYTYRRIAQAIGVSDQNLRAMLASENVKSETLERIAAAMSVHVAYFYDMQPIFTLVDYGEFAAQKRENELLREIIRDKDRLIEELKAKR